MTISKLAPVIAILGLAACGSGGGGSSDGADEVTHDLSISALRNSVRLIDAQAISFDVTPDGAIQTNGEVGYAGPATLIEAAGPNEAVFAAIGNAELTVDFGESSISGQADNFYQFNDTVLAELNRTGDISEKLSSNNLTAIAGTLTFNPATDGVAGTLTKTSGELAGYDLQIVDIEFYGPNADIIEVFSVGDSAASGRSDEAAGLFVTAIR